MSLFKFSKDGEDKAGHLPANLRNQTSQSKVIIDSIDDGVVLFDEQALIQLINPGAARICGWATEEATGIDVYSVMKLTTEKGESIASAINPLHKIFGSNVSLRGDNLFLQNRSNQQIPITLNVSPILDSAQRVTAAVAIFNNVTKERAEEKQRADFISTASHEMRTPVAAIEGYLALALNDKVSTIDNRARDFLEKAHASAQHLGQLFQDLLTSAKAEDGRLTSHPVVVEIGHFLEQLVEDFRLVAEKKGLALDFTTGSNSTVINATRSSGEKVVQPLYYIYVDPDRLREVITNLFDNAIKYTSEGKISIGLTGNDQVVQCSVRDTGPGIPEEDVPHLFQKFYRVDNSATRTIGGTGLGLFICRKIIELYEGRIWVESELGKGSNFYINLPRLSTQKANELQGSGNGNIIKPISTNVTA